MHDGGAGRMERIATQRDNWLPRIREKMAKVNEKFSASMANMGYSRRSPCHVSAPVTS